MNNNNRFFQIIKLVAATSALLFLIGGVANLVSKQPAPVTLVKPTATSTETPSATPTLYASLPGSSTATPTPSVTLTATANATFTPAPTATATATSVPSPATPTEPVTPELSATPTEEPTDTATPSPTNTATPIDTVIPTEAAAIITATLTLTFTATPSGPPTLTPTPTSTPTPVPRTERADNAPNYSLAEPHFWFTRPYNDTYATWGSQFYPYGTNNDGNYLWHHGIDIQNPDGTPILAVGDGQVVFASVDEQQAIGPQPNFYGQAVIILHNQTIEIANTEKRPVYTLYGHVSQVLVQKGESVVTGQPIALTGQEGVALGPHLHLEVRLDQNTYLKTQNPDLWVRPDPGYGVIAGRVVDANGFYVPQQLITLHRAETPNKFWRQTRTYPDHRYTFDPQLGETFTFADVPAGAYIAKTTFDGRNYSLPVTVTNQALSFVLIEGHPPPTVTPIPDTPVTATPVTP